MRGNLFFIGVAGFCSGIVLGTLYHLPIATLAPCAIIIVFCLGAWMLEHNIWYVALNLYIVCLVFGGVRANFSQVTIPDAFVPIIDAKVTLIGTVVAPPDVREKDERLTVEVVRNTARTQILATVSKNLHVPVGEQIQVSGKLELPEPFATDGGRTFAYDKFLAKDGVFALMAYADVNMLAPPSGWYWIWNALVNVNIYVQKLLQRAIPTPYSSLAIGILLGGKQGLGDDILKTFTTAGLVQVVVLSGFNVSIVVSSLLAVSKNFSRTIGLVVAAVGVCAFIAATGLGASAIRAGLMALVALLGNALHRTYDVVRALCVTLVLMVLWNPLTLIYDPGFQFSFIATLGLVIGSPLLETRLKWVTSGMLRELLATTFAAEIAVLPILLYQTGSLSVVSIPANMLVSPIVPVAMAASGIAALGTLVMPSFAAFIGYPAYASLWWIMQIANKAAGLPFAAVVVPAFPVWVLFLVYALLAVLIYVARR